MKKPQSRKETPEIASFTRYYEHDGMLRAYANRAMFLAILFAVVALSSLGFPQEVVNQIAERTGGRPVTVEVSGLCDGEVEIDSEGRIFLVQPLTQPNGQIVERLIFIAQVTKTGEVFTDRDEKGSPVVLERVRKFPIKAGRSAIRNGKVIFPDTQQRPQLPNRGVVPLLETN